MRSNIDENGNAINGIANEKGRCKISFNGSNNTITFGQGVTLENTSILFNGSNASLHIDDNATVEAIFSIGDNSHISIGKAAKFNKLCRFVALEGANIKIGAKCLLASVKFRTTDNHSIIDIATGQRINPARDIIIGDHVWIADDVKILKGVEVGNRSIIGTGSIVTSIIPPYSLAVGVPAKVVKKGVSWTDKRLPPAEPVVLSTQKPQLSSQRPMMKQHSPLKIATFGSKLSRQVANNFTLLFDGKVVSSVCHNRSDYFCHQLLQRQRDPAALTELLATPFSEQLLRQDREDNILQMLKNQAIKSIGLHRLSKGVNFFQAIESGLIDLLIIDNGIDLSAPLFHSDENDTEPFMLLPEQVSSLITSNTWLQGNLLTAEQSASSMAELISHIRQQSPQTRIVFIQAPGYKDETNESHELAYQATFRNTDCCLLPLLPKASSGPLYATYAGMIKGLALVSDLKGN